MIAVNQDSSYNTTASTTNDVDSTNNTEVVKVRSYVKELLKSRIFLGRYLERRLCEPRIGYRDVVLLSPAEVDLKRDLTEAQYKLRSLSPNVWVGITDGELIGHAGICIWTEIDNQPFGPFWFQIRSVKFRQEEVVVTVKCIRHISESFLEIEPILTGLTKKKAIAPQAGQPNSSNNSAEVLSETFSDIKDTLKGVLSIRNVKEFITFVCAFVIAVFTGGNALITFLGNFVLALIREMSILIKNSTPLFLGFLDFLSKIVGGFYILVAMFFRPNKPVPVDRRSIAYNYETKNRRSHRPYDYTID